MNNYGKISSNNMNLRDNYVNSPNQLLVNIINLNPSHIVSQPR